MQLTAPFITRIIINHAGLKMLLSNIFVKYSEEKSVSGEVSEIGEHHIEIGKVC